MSLNKVTLVPDQIESMTILMKDGSRFVIQGEEVQALQVNYDIGRSEYGGFDYGEGMRFPRQRPQVHIEMYSSGVTYMQPEPPITAPQRMAFWGGKPVPSGPWTGIEIDVGPVVGEDGPEAFIPLKKASPKREAAPKKKLALPEPPEGPLRKIDLEDG